MAAVRTKTISFQAIVQNADPEWVQRTNYIPEYEFSSAKKAKTRRVFFGRYKERGAYADDVS